MFRKSTSLILLAVFIISLSGCAIARRQEYNQKIKGWEYVRIEREVPHKDCVYIIQSACSGRGTNCYTQLKKDAKKYDANTVVITEDIRSWKEGSSMATGTWSGSEIANTLADLYNCPKYEIKQSLPSEARKSTNKSDILLRVEQPK